MSIESHIALLSKIPRTGWLIRGVEQPETVADHIFGTLVIAMLLQKVYQQEQHLDCEGILVMSLIHDIMEAYTGDLTPRTKKYLPLNSPDLSYIEFETLHFRKILNLLPEHSRRLLDDIWVEFSTNETWRSRQVHIIDVVEMLSQAYEYEKTGQRKLDEFWRWVADCRGNDFLFNLARVIQRRRNFLKASSTIQYQHFESCEHHSDIEFADKLITLDLNTKTERDKIIERFFTSRNCQRMISSSNPLFVLDVGCGLGSFSRFFIESGVIECQVKGIDINPYLLEAAKKRWEHAPFECMPPTDIGWFWNIESSSLDVVLVGEVLEHIFNPWFVLMESFRVLKEDGLLLISVPNSFHEEKKKRYQNEEMIELRYKEEHIRYFGPKQLVNILRETGFQVEELWGLDKKWSKSFKIAQKRNHYSDAKHAWTLVACGRKIDKKKLQNDTHLFSPDRHTHQKTLLEWIEEHSKAKRWAQIHGFIEEINKAKLLRADLTNSASETIAQQTFRLAFLASCIAAEMNLNHECAILCVLFQGIVESHLAEIAPQIRASFAINIQKKALQDVLQALPQDLVVSLLNEYDKLYSNTEQWLIAEYLLNREYNKIGHPRNNSIRLDKLINNSGLFMHAVNSVLKNDII